MTQQREEVLQKVETHIPGLDYICDGGLPENRTTLISGTSGSGKTILAAQFLAAGITEAGYGGVFVTFEESAADIRKNMLSFGWDISAWEAEGRWAFVDVSQITETHLSTATDNILLLKYVELEGFMKRALAVIKARGSEHEKELRELIIDKKGMSIGEPFVGVENLMAGSAKRISS